MKLLILLRGQHYQINGKGPISWKDCFHSLHEHYVKHYPNDTIFFYFSTYDSPELNELIETYNPINYISYNTADFNKHNQSNNLYNLLLLVENPTEYDQVLVTRFDVLYKIPVTQWNLEKDKIMIPFQQPDSGLNDCIHVFPGSLYHSFMNKLKDYHADSIHYITFDDTKFMFEKKYYSDTDYPEYFPLNTNPLYILHRIRRWGPMNKESARKEAIQQGWTTKSLSKSITSTSRSFSMDMAGDQLDLV